MYLSPADAFNLIGDLAKPISDVPYRAFSEGLDDARASRYQFTRTRSNIMFDDMARIARLEFAGLSEVTEHRSHGTVFWVLKGQVLFRYKKLNRKRRPMGLPTQRAIDLLTQPDLYHPTVLPLGSLPVSMMPRLVVGYVLNDIETEIEQLLLVLSGRHRNVWEVPLAIEATGRILDYRGTDQPASAWEPVRPKLRDVGNEDKASISANESGLYRRDGRGRAKESRPNPDRACSANSYNSRRTFSGGTWLAYPI